MKIKEFYSKLKKLPVMFTVFVFLSVPSSTNYKLKSFEFGAGGEKDMNSSNYKMEGIAGELNGQQSSTNYKVNSGIFYVQMANTPGAPTFVNSSNWYNKLKITLNTSNNPSDTTYAIAISTDNFTTTQYVQSDNTVGATLGIEDFQTYTAWGGGSGTFIIGLQSGTTYQVKVKARQGLYTEGPYGPTAQSNTVDPSIAFDLDVSSSDQDNNITSVIFGDLAANSVTTATDKIWIDFETNAENGGEILVKGLNSGLKTTSKNHTIVSVSANLTGQTEAWGIQGDTITQSTGGPLAFQSPYNGSSDIVGIVNTTLQPIISSSLPLTLGRASILLKAKISSTTPAADDYEEPLTFIATAIF